LAAAVGSGRDGSSWHDGNDSGCGISAVGDTAVGGTILLRHREVQEKDKGNRRRRHGESVFLAVSGEPHVLLLLLWCWLSCVAPMMTALQCH
jgi:hypothetical protein